MRAGLDRLVDMENVSFFTEVVSPAKRLRVPIIENSKGLCCFFLEIAQDGIVQLQGFSESTIGSSVVAAGGEAGDIELTKLLATLTE